MNLISNVWHHQQYNAQFSRKYKSASSGLGYKSAGMTYCVSFSPRSHPSTAGPLCFWTMFASYSYLACSSPSLPSSASSSRWRLPRYSQGECGKDQPHLLSFGSQSCRQTGPRGFLLPMSTMNQKIHRLLLYCHGNGLDWIAELRIHLQVVALRILRR